jgi:hypothetical protein
LVSLRPEANEPGTLALRVPKCLRNWLTRVCRHVAPADVLLEIVWPGYQWAFPLGATPYSAGIPT